MEVQSAFVEAGTRVEQRGEAEDCCQQGHGGCQPIDHQDDAERRWPVAEGVDAQLAVVGEHGQPGRDQDQQRRGRQANQALAGQAAASHLQQGGGKRDQQRQDRRVRVHGSSRAST
jgi:hypothetical protein